MQYLSLWHLLLFSFSFNAGLILINAWMMNNINHQFSNVVFTLWIFLYTNSNENENRITLTLQSTNRYS